MEEELAIVCPLRQDLQLLEGSSDSNGCPRWRIYDPVAHRFFQIGWLEFEILHQWGAGDVASIAAAVAQNSPFQVSTEQIQAVEHFLTTHQLLSLPESACEHTAKPPHKGWSWWMKSYLFFYIPLVYPDTFLEKTLPYVQRLVHRVGVYALMVLAMIGIYLVSRQWSVFIAPMRDLFNWQNMGLFALAISLVKVVHELSHGYVAKYYGCRVSTFGVAFLVFFPVLYTDVTDAWKLKDDSQRIWINAAGILAELTIAILATFLWSFMPAGAPQSIMAYLAIVSWALSLFVNLNPMLRFDGYYLLADYVGVDNFQQQSFRLALWHLRECLFGLGEPPPILWDPKKTRFALLYAYCTWVYRFFLLLSIALIIYFMFFKALGLLLMLAEVIFFIVLPIGREIVFIYRKRKELRVNRNTVVSSGVFFLVLCILVIPWHDRVTISGMSDFSQQSKLYTAYSGEIKRWFLHDGVSVKKDQLLWQLSSPEMILKRQKVEADINSARSRLAQQLSDRTRLGFQQVSREDIARLEKEKRSIDDQLSRLMARAPFDGALTDVVKGLKTGVWVDADQYLGQLVGTHSIAYYGFLPETDLSRVQPGDTARFYPSTPDATPVDLCIDSIDVHTLETLPNRLQASIYGGDIAVANADLALDTGLYRIAFAPVHPSEGSGQVVRGTIIIEGQKKSLLLRAWKAVAAVMIRESGF